jgi:hypothetical protein
VVCFSSIDGMKKFYEKADFDSNDFHVLISLSAGATYQIIN